MTDTVSMTFLLNFPVLGGWKESCEYQTPIFLADAGAYEKRHSLILITEVGSSQTRVWAPIGSQARGFCFFPSCGTMKSFSNSDDVSKP